LLFSTTTALAALTITLPRQDSLTTSSVISVSGTASDETVVVRIEGLEDEAVAQVNNNGKWSVNLTLAEGLNEVTASSGSQKQRVLVTLTTMSVQPKRQKVLLRWSPATTEELKGIVVGTRQGPPLSSPKQNAFAESVKKSTRAFIAQNFSLFAIDIVDSDTESDDKTHIIDFVPDVHPLTYGESQHDCRNSVPNQTSKVFVGTFRDEMVNKFSNWAPMAKSDSFDRRVKDVAYALARTASHELGHSLGLVTENESSACGWMDGCDLNHTCRYSSPHLLAHRFADGRYIMDDGVGERVHADRREAAS
jgi:hypothetical protein